MTDKYRFIQKYACQYGLRWLLQRMNVYPNAYYNYLKDRKSAYRSKKKMIKTRIATIYHENHGILGYRQMQIFLKREGVTISALTCHKYMNTEMHMYSITRKKKKYNTPGESHKVFDNLLNRDFTADKPNKKWCIDFTYLNLKNGNRRYNCTIIDLYDRSVVASVTGKYITAELACETIAKAMNDNKSATNTEVILHSDQGSQFTSREFSEKCSSYGIRQSMSRAGCPYDNAVMERYFNTLKSELTNNYIYKSDKELNEAISNYAYVWYNHKRPHSSNGGMTPAQKRISFYAAKAA